MFDEAWAGFLKFHPLFNNCYAMGLKNLDEDSPGIISTQSTHKQMASFSQASQIHVRDRHIKGQNRRIEHRASTRPSCCTPRHRPSIPCSPRSTYAAQMMRGRSGEVLWDDTVRLGIEPAQEIRAIKREFVEKEKDPARHWFFDPFVPDMVSVPGGSRWRGRTCPPMPSPPCALLGIHPGATGTASSKSPSRATP